MNQEGTFMKVLSNAVEVAEFMVAYAYNKEKPISNLQLQKILYFLWIEYYKKNQIYLFSEKFAAWLFGPVIPEVYYEFCAYGGLPITESFEIDLKNDAAEKFIKHFVDKYSGADPFKMVAQSHQEGHAWDLIFNKDGKGTGNRTPIPFELIIEKEC